jgi:hypothetical protein
MEDSAELIKWLRESKGRRPQCRRGGTTPAEKKAATLLSRLHGCTAQRPLPPDLQSLVDEVSQVLLES